MWVLKPFCLFLDDSNLVAVLNEDEKMKILSSDNFMNFFERSARIMEKALTNPDDNIMIDYTYNETVPEEWVIPYLSKMNFYPYSNGLELWNTICILFLNIC